MRWPVAPQRFRGVRMGWVFLGCFVAAGLTGDARGAAPAQGARTVGLLSWEAIGDLCDRQRVAEAERAIADRLTAARAAGKGDDWARALLEGARVRRRFADAEGALRYLRGQPWPAQALGRVTVDLHYATSLLKYAQDNAYEIARRDRVEGAADDPALWTRSEIYHAALAAYRDAWSRREALGTRPVRDLAEVVLANDYPAEVRGTARDALTYLLVELLANDSFWTPDQSADRWLLDPASLLEAQPSPASAVAEELHPLPELVGALDDLERWHLAAGRRSAALEARCERTRRLCAALRRPSVQRVFIEDLERRLEAYRDLPWYAAGMATVADLWVGADSEAVPDARVRALRAAAAATAAFPDTRGGQHAAMRRDYLTGPSLTIEGMTSDGVGRRSLRLWYSNLSRVFFRAYQLDSPEAAIRVDHLLREATPVARWAVDLAATPDLQSHWHYVTPPLTEHGTYAVLASIDERFDESAHSVHALSLTLSDLVLQATAEAPGHVRVLALSGETGEPVPGVDVEARRNGLDGEPLEVQRGRTDAAGECHLAVSGAAGRVRWSGSLLARHGQDAAELRMTIAADVPAESPRNEALVYTDRSVYRPLQTVRWKVLAYRKRWPDGIPQPAPGQTVTVTLLDATREPAATVTVTTNEFSAASGEFVLPPGHLLGQWTVSGGFGVPAEIAVEEYKRPTFEVTWNDPIEAPRLDRPIELHGDVTYYAGTSVTGGTVRWRVTRQPVMPAWFEGPVAQTAISVVATGRAEVDSTGGFVVRFTPRWDERLGEDPAVTFRYTVAADVTDEGGETRSAERALRVGRSPIEVVFDDPTGFRAAHQPSDLALVRQDLDGAPRAGAGRYRLLALRNPARATLPADEPFDPADPDALGTPVRTPDDLLRPRWPGFFGRLWGETDWAKRLRTLTDGEEVAEGELVHDTRGRAVITLPALPAGLYRVRCETLDPFGRAVRAQHELVVAGPGEAPPVPVLAVLLASQSEVNVGEVARFLVRGGFPGQFLVLDRLRGGVLVDRRTLRAGVSDGVIEIPVREEDRGGFAVRLIALRDHQLFAPQASVFVPWDDRELKVELSSFRDLVHPGDQEVWRLTVRAPGSDRPAPAELLAYMYDRSLDAIRPHDPPEPSGQFPSRDWSDKAENSLGAALGEWSTSPFGSSREPRPYRPDSVGLYGFTLHWSWDPRRSNSDPPRLGAAVTVTAESPALDERKMMTGASIGQRGRRVSDRAQPEAAPPATAVNPRRNWNETAFWMPHLLTDAAGNATLEFRVPDALTSWSFWAHAVTKDSRSGWISRQIRSARDLMVRPILPRYLREGDRARLRVLVENTTGAEVHGQLTLDLLDPESDATVADRFGLKNAGMPRDFTIEPNGRVAIDYDVTAPAGLGEVAVRATARAGQISDGELRRLPLLPSRLYLAQSRLTALTGHGEATVRRELRFDELARQADPTRRNERLVVTVDAQLFDAALAALPYLVESPFDGVEQTLNRFVSTDILTSLFDRYPAIARLAKSLPERGTRETRFDGEDPNRDMQFEETPFLAEARGGSSGGIGSGGDRLLRVLDPQRASAARTSALARLQSLQLPSGGFAWWPGGPESETMTLYALFDLAQASEFGGQAPKPMVTQAWHFLGARYHAQFARAIQSPDCDCRWEFLTWMNYIASSYPDESWLGGALTANDRKDILAASLRHVSAQSRYLRGMLALTLQRAGRPADARRVFAGIMSGARTSPDLGTYWPPEAQPWTWCQDAIESHAFVLRALLEVAPDDPRRDGLVQWLLLNRQLNHWKSTRATAQVLYVLAKVLQTRGELTAREDATVQVGARPAEHWTFAPDEYTGGRNRLVVEGKDLTVADAQVAVEKSTPGLLFASATWQFSTERLPASESGDLFHIARRYFLRRQDGRETRLQPIVESTQVAAGDEIVVRLELSSRAPAEFVHVADPRAAGLEPVGSRSGWRWDAGALSYQELRDGGTHFFFERLTSGRHVITYRLRAATAGVFRVGPATLQSLYAPEFQAYSSGATLTVRAN